MLSGYLINKTWFTASNTVSMFALLLETIMNLGTICKFFLPLLPSHQKNLGTFLNFGCFWCTFMNFGTFPSFTIWRAFIRSKGRLRLCPLSINYMRWLPLTTVIIPSVPLSFSKIIMIYDCTRMIISCSGSNSLTIVIIVVSSRQAYKHDTPHSTLNANSCWEDLVKCGCA